MNEFVTWEALGSYAGAVMMVTLITQFLKGTPPAELEQPAGGLWHRGGAAHRGGSLWRAECDGAGGGTVPAERGDGSAGGQWSIRRGQPPDDRSLPA